jgi:hypothetical protein
MIKDELLGKPMLERMEYVKNNLMSSDFKNEIFIFSGTPAQTRVKVFMVDIDFPIYRLKNIRTKGPQQSYIATNEVSEDFFSRDGESRKALLVQHELLLKIAESAEFGGVSHVDAFERGGYDLAHPMIMSSNGVLINGNTRMSALRHLYNSDQVKYERYSKIPIGVLPSSFTERDFRKLELNLQINPDLKKKYSWTSEAQDCLEQVESGVSIDSLSDEYDRRSNDASHPKNLLNQLKIAKKYLKTYSDLIDYSTIEKDQFAFWAWAEWRSTLDNDLDKQFTVDLICGQMINNPEGHGNLYKNIKAKYKEYRLDPSLYGTSLNQVNNDMNNQESEEDLEEVVDQDDINEDDQTTDNLDSKYQEDEYGFLDEFEEDEENLESETASEKKIVNRIRERLKTGKKVDIVSAVENVISNKNEEEKRSKDLNLIYTDSVDIKEKVVDCLKRFKVRNHEYENLNEAVQELKIAEIKIKALYELIENSSK